MLDPGGRTKCPVAVLDDFLRRAAPEEIPQLGPGSGIELQGFITEERSVLKHLQKSAHLDFCIDLSFPNLGDLVNELLEVDMRKPVRKLLDMLDDLAKDIVVIELCRIWRREVFERHLLHGTNFRIFRKGDATFVEYGSE